MVSYCYVPQATHSELLSMLVDPERGAAKIEQCLAAGNGLIVWTAHVGNWEFASRLLEMHGRPVNVARVVEDKPAEITLRNLMINPQLKIVDLKGGVTATIELLQALRRNEIVAMQGDRVYQRHSADVPFFSQPSSLSAWPLSAFAGLGRSGAARLRDSRRLAALPRPDGVDPIQVPSEHPRSLLKSHLPSHPRSHPDDRDAGLQDALCQAVRFLEKTLTTYYDQWMNFFEFWPVASRE